MRMRKQGEEIWEAEGLLEICAQAERDKAAAAKYYEEVVVPILAPDGA